MIFTLDSPLGPHLKYDNKSLQLEKFFKDDRKLTLRGIVKKSMKGQCLEDSIFYRFYVKLTTV